jgi:DNA repair exonuclease SbcCD ATPase subunit
MEGIEMSDTPRTDAEEYESQDEPITKLGSVDAEFARTIERELNAANELIKRLQAVTNDPHALWANWLRGSVALPVGIGDVREYQDRIKMLEEDLMDAKNKHAALVADVALYEDRGERIKRLEEAGNELMYDNDDMANINRWHKAKYE